MSDPAGPLLGGQDASEHLRGAVQRIAGARAETLADAAAQLRRLAAMTEADAQPRALLSSPDARRRSRPCWRRTANRRLRRRPRGSAGV